MPAVVRTPAELVAYLSGLGQVGLVSDPSAIGGGRGLHEKLDKIMAATATLSEVQNLVIVRYQQLSGDLRAERAAVKIAIDGALNEDPYVRAAASQKERESRARNRERARFERVARKEAAVSELKAVLDVANVAARNLKTAKEAVSRQIALLELEQQGGGQRR